MVKTEKNENNEIKYFTICDTCGKTQEVQAKYYKVAQKKENNFCKSCVQKGRIPWNKGLTKETDERVKRNGESTSKGRLKSNIIGWNKGLTKETDERVKRHGELISKAKKGVPILKNRRTNYKTLASQHVKKLLKNAIYVNWTLKIMERDGFKCTNCNTKSNLEVHHIKPYREILEESLLELNLKFNEYENWSEEEIFSLKDLILKKHTLDIGITYCMKCHGYYDKYREKFLT